MSDLRTAAQQALEALEYHVEQTRPIWKTSEAIAALEAALAEEALQRFTDVNQELEAALAEPVEPAPLYTAPPQRKPLSEEEIKRIDDSTHFHESPDWSLRFARAVERAHGIT